MLCSIPCVKAASQLCSTAQLAAQQQLAEFWEEDNGTTTVPLPLLHIRQAHPSLAAIALSVSSQMLSRDRLSWSYRIVLSSGLWHKPDSAGQVFILLHAACTLPNAALLWLVRTARIISDPASPSALWNNHPGGYSCPPNLKYRWTFRDAESPSKSTSQNEVSKKQRIFCIVWIESFQRGLLGKRVQSTLQNLSDWFLAVPVSRIPTWLTGAEPSLHFAPQQRPQPDLHSLFDYVHRLVEARCSWHLPHLNEPGKWALWGLTGTSHKLYFLLSYWKRWGGTS